MLTNNQHNIKIPYFKFGCLLPHFEAKKMIFCQVFRANKKAQFIPSDKMSF